MKNNEIVCCPVCGQLIELVGKTMVCSNGHSYDVAKEGYVNLLLCNNKNSKNPGDNKLMLTARKDFLNSGAYEKLLDNIIKIVKDHVMPQSNIVEAGCGEGYYISNLSNSLSNNNYYAFDISKDAIKLASRRQSKVNFYVASSYNSLIKESSVDCLLVVFAPFVEEEFSRILSSGGICIVVTPNDEHMLEIKKELYNNVKEAPRKNYKMFKVYKSFNVKYMLNVGSAIENLIKMTPFYYNTKIDNIQKILERLHNLPIKIDFSVEVLKKM